VDDTTFHTEQLHGWLDRMRGGDRAAFEELLTRIDGRLRRLARAMLRRFPGVKRWEDTGDVVQNASLRLLRALREERPASVRAFFGLAALQLRRELLDLARHYQGPHGLGANHASNAGEGTAARGPEPAAPDDPEELARWAEFHEAVGGLPPREREVVGLRFYHGWKEKEIAALLGVDERTVRRDWRAACGRLKEAVKGLSLRA
jgi:RNA polymerase sigma factor (sigma-70 family)